MKCIKNKSGKVLRVSDQEAMELTNKGTWNYCPKSEWKNSKASAPTPAVPVEEVKEEKPKKAKKPRKTDKVRKTKVHEADKAEKISEKISEKAS